MLEIEYNKIGIRKDPKYPFKLKWIVICPECQKQVSIEILYKGHRVRIISRNATHAGALHAALQHIKAHQHGWIAPIID